MIRDARKEDAEEIVELFKIVLVDMELPIMEIVSWEKLKPVLVEAAKEEKYQISYKNAVVKESEGKIIGFFYGYKGGTASQSYEPIEALFKKYDLPPFDADGEESFEGEWYLDTLVTKKAYRGKGIGKELLEAAFDKARASGMALIGLDVDQVNPRAKALYERMGFEKMDEVVLSNHNYDHMQRKV
ncbi:MAG: GNAT family N-acetyltransferase [Alkalibacterium sp.]|uniref:Acetyltransferase (GNAT) family protein n=1 Tax=Alkalibacterium gilvum TaxID=1130080 RepID=A0A1H6UD53_9LACT|nr:GNAT family N-acetyltransferase [Alkalibacterium gilvum]MDN6193883.1 GNAT family N-acetyltransferase [Alkalibacterium sp.]MDN6326608.1 GNAT family N-acetyltransferase [Alkalibacterium sp.]MDN6385733.1 GNAT family N-acetyltransferase [Alkalibacterium sp.]MDN6397741.1 GNAT family N-acetyltransferase [Alkalibacterium sp.]SEI90279.1 Acetyltransferase (GNAT) family protein [Alkalibacterium gilvum]